MIKINLRRGRESCVWHKTASDGEVSVLEILGVLSTPSLLLLPGPHWLEVVVPVKVPSVGQIDLSKKIFVFERTVRQKKTLKKQKYVNLSVQ